MASIASVRKISDSSCRSDLRSVKASQLPPVGVTCSRTLLGARQPRLARPSPAQPQGILGYEKLVAEQAHPPRIGTGQCSTDLWGTLPYPAVWCGAMRAYEHEPSDINLHMTTPQLSERADTDACTARLILQSWLLEQYHVRSDYMSCFQS